MIEQDKKTKLSCFVIAISGASGSGKSALVKALVHRLGDAEALHFDDYSPRYFPTSKYPNDIAKWIADGADPSAWETPQLVLDLRALRQGKSITLPGYKEVSRPTTFIIRALGRRKPLVFPMKSIDELTEEAAAHVRTAASSLRSACNLTLLQLALLSLLPAPAPFDHYGHATARRERRTRSRV